jgi:transposase
LKPFRNKELFETGRLEVEALLSLHKQGFITLYFADESHFGLTPNVPYAWQYKDNPILLPCRKSNRLTVFGLLSTESDLKYYTTQGSMNSEYLIACIDEFRQTITKKTIIVLDNVPIHRNKVFKNRIKEWQKDDLYIYFLPPYSPELNKIEILWRFIKYKWLPFDAFLNFNNLKERLNEVLDSIGIKYNIYFY